MAQIRLFDGTIVQIEDPYKVPYSRFPGDRGVGGSPPLTGSLRRVPDGPLR